MKRQQNTFPKCLGTALKDALLDASDEKLFECAWNLFEQKPEVKKVLKATEMEAYAKLNDPALKTALEQTVADIRVEAEEFYLALGVLIGQKYAVHSPEIQKELEYLEMRMKGAGILPLSVPIAPR